VCPAVTPRCMCLCNTGQFVTPSGISDLCSRVDGKGTPLILSAVSVLVLAQPSSEVPEELMNSPAYIYIYIYIKDSII
jgi:hypothetical protein